MTKTDRVFALMSLLAVVFLIIMTNLTTPSEIGPLGVLVFFALIYLACLGVMVGLCRVLFAIGERMQRNKARAASRKKSYYYGSILAFIPMMLIFMRSFGELDFSEVVLVMFFALIGCFYISKRA